VDSEREMASPCIEIAARDREIAGGAAAHGARPSGRQVHRARR
jgi:hypothetical protein